MEAIIDYRGKTPQKTTWGVPLITAKVVKGGRIETPNEFIAPEQYDTWMRRGIPKRGDVVMTTEAPLGEVAQLGAGRVALAQRLIALRGNPRLLDNTFLKFLLQSNTVQEQLRARASGTTVLGIKQSELRKVVLTLPTLSQQRAIAHILGSLDDRIETNRLTNQALEGIARAIFKSWFVDFDPVRAKAEGRQPNGMNSATAALFPDSFEDSELGKIPRGWQVTTLSKVVTVYDSLRVPLSNRERANRQGKYPYYGAADRLDFVDDYLFDGIYVLMGEDGSVIDAEDRPVLQYVWGRFWVSNHAHVLQGRDGLTTDHLYVLLRNVNLRPYVTGAVQPKLNQGNLLSISVVLPSPKIVRRFADMIAPLFTLRRLIADETICLTALRDALLPRLLNGDITVRDSEELT